MFFFNLKFDEQFSADELKVRLTAERIRKKMENERMKFMFEQLSWDLCNYGFNSGEWDIKLGEHFLPNGHWCSNSNIENYSNLLIVNKKRPEDLFHGWCDWVHLKKCNEKPSKISRNHLLKCKDDFQYYVNYMKKGYKETKYKRFDKNKFIYFWDLIDGPEKLAKKYSVQLKKEVGLPKYVLEKHKQIYW